MTVTEWAVVAGGLAAIAWVNWYFFLAGSAGSAPRPRGGASQESRQADDGNDRG